MRIALPKAMAFPPPIDMTESGFRNLRTPRFSSMQGRMHCCLLGENACDPAYGLSGHARLGMGLREKQRGREPLSSQLIGKLFQSPPPNIYSIGVRAVFSRPFPNPFSLSRNQHRKAP